LRSASSWLSRSSWSWRLGGLAAGVALVSLPTAIAAAVILIIAGLLLLADRH
jgi:hypothetical protein